MSKSKRGESSQGSKRKTESTSSGDDDVEYVDRNVVMAENVSKLNIKEFDEHIQGIANVISDRMRLEMNAEFGLPEGANLFRGNYKKINLAGGRYSIRFSCSYVGESCMCMH